MAVGMLPPMAGMGLANYLSRRSRAQTGAAEEIFLGEDKEWLILYCKEILTKKNIDFFIFGHRHLAMIIVFLPSPPNGKGQGVRPGISILATGSIIILMQCLMEIILN